MDQFRTADLRDLIAERPGPCVSLYAAVSPGGSVQDPIPWKNLLREAEQCLEAAGTRSPEARDLLRPAFQLFDDVRFWQCGGNGLACFLAAGFARHYRLGLSWPERAAVGRVFYVKPLLPWLAEAGRFYVLAVSQNAVRLLRCADHGCAPVPLRGPASREEALRAHDTDEMLSCHTFGQGPGARRAAFHGHRAAFHGHGVGVDDAKDDLLLYCRAIDQELHPVLRDESAPLAIAAVNDLLPIFREACSYPHVLEHGIPGNPEHLSDRDLAERARSLFAPRLRRQRQKVVEVFQQLAGTGRTTNEVSEVVAAAARGAVDTVFVPLGCDVWGRLDPESGRADVHAVKELGDDELTNLAAVFALRQGRTVYALPPEEMPEGSALAAVRPLPLAKHR
jgi:hypothetical protein